MKRNLSVRASTLILALVVLAIGAVYSVQWGRHAFLTTRGQPKNRTVATQREQAWDSHRSEGRSANAERPIARR